MTKIIVEVLMPNGDVEKHKVDFKPTARIKHGEKYYDYVVRRKSIYYVKVNGRRELKSYYRFNDPEPLDTTKRESALTAYQVFGLSSGILPKIVKDGLKQDFAISSKAIKWGLVLGAVVAVIFIFETYFGA